MTLEESKKWTAFLRGYDKTLLTAKKDKKKSEELAELDRWFSEVLPESISSRTPPSMNKDELVKLMEWKLQRGKFRPLMNKLKANGEDTVRMCTTEAFGILESLPLSLPGDLRGGGKKGGKAVELSDKVIASVVSKTVKALKVLTQMKAVGPATASAIACAYRADVIPFFSDELAATACKSTKLQYNLKEYEEIQAFALRLCGRLLMAPPGAGDAGPSTGPSSSSSPSSGFPSASWDCRAVERAVWVSVRASSVGEDCGPGPSVRGASGSEATLSSGGAAGRGKGKKRGSEAVSGDGSEPSKSLKTKGKGKGPVVEIDDD
uniref:Uncharacterized protein n=1 Tax=Chromera velia CCMP2878 TaxID=1169474 RepID=A0A0G4F937_9ALVE|eukprot:Cvel_15658.t1-p1 / transcript=Cvel_15658.t1 / gene=Cvel_15658 / organism=Chromera_velia_CCMP2878 / gene_product=hypothetical protein / transcript_product=hypothetical protein / location=Cvel_scaffold1168:48048-51630(+) / protein_length=319 / sequence_SO=supercontig / SO=protein_coding / is_pseudo=false